MLLKDANTEGVFTRYIFYMYLYKMFSVVFSVSNMGNHKDKRLILKGEVWDLMLWCRCLAHRVRMLRTYGAGR